MEWTHKISWAICWVLLASATTAFADSRPWNLTSSISAYSSRWVFGTDDRTLQTDFGLLGRYRLADGFSASFALSITQEIAGLGRQLLDDGQVGFNYDGFAISRIFRTSAGLFFALPFSIQSHDRDSLYTAATFSPVLIADLGPLGLKSVTANFKPSFTRAFHQYDTATYGFSEFEYVFKGGAGLSWNPVEKLTLSLGGSRSVLWTYQGNTFYLFGLSEEASMLLGRGFRAAVGHSNSGDQLKVNGQDSNISWASEEGSTVYTTLEYSF